MGILPDLFLTFARIGLFTFGGGYAMIALIEDACVEKKQWITHDEMPIFLPWVPATLGRLSEMERKN